MAYQSTFARYEMKYLVSMAQKERIIQAISPFMKLDKYGRTTIRNIYLDTDSYRLIRRSLEKPTYKEKLRLRSYSRLTPEEGVFVEIKKKYKKTVYKRRLTLPEGTVMRAFEEDMPLGVSTQIGNEIEYFRSYYGYPKPRVFLSYEREAYYHTGGGDFRITFDDNIFYRTYDLSLCSEPYGEPLLAEGMALMEIKTSGGIPLSLVKVLTEERIYKTSFSKYGTAYARMLSKKLSAPITEREEREIEEQGEGEFCNVRIF